MILSVALAALALQVPAPTLLAAGDVAACDSRGDEATARILARVKGTIAMLGDGAYPSGSAADYARCYRPSWGRFRGRTRPAAGNHEYGTRGATGYFRYFGRRAGPRGRGWYAYTLGAWRVIVLNSNCGAAGGCDAGSAQGQWLRAELAQSSSLCTLAYWHHPRWSSGAMYGSNPGLDPFWRMLYAADADVVLNGHVHNYERFAPQAPSGASDPERGIRQFVVGTGGNRLYAFARPLATSQVRSASTYGVLRLTLRDGRYDWRFVPVSGTFSDAGSDTCH